MLNREKAMLGTVVNCARTPPFARAVDPWATAGSPSSSVTAAPARASSRAQASPMIPPPITTTSLVGTGEP